MALIFVLPLCSLSLVTGSGTAEKPEHLSQIHPTNNTVGRFGKP
jgi:hypothetical protein